MIGREDFAGRWTIERRIEDRLAAGTGVFEGQAVFSNDGADGLIYDEMGELLMPDGSAFQATRRYLWAFIGTQVDVRFDDGRAFHRFDLRDGAQAEHLCGDDLYQVRYDFAGWPEWHADWAVQGPRKDYVMRSVMRRAGPD